MQEEIAPAIARKIIEADVALWRNTLYQATVRMRVSARAGNKEIEKEALKDAENAQKMLDGYEAELATLPKETENV